MSKRIGAGRSDSLPLDQIIEGDSWKVMAQMPDRSVDLVFADPPYNLQLSGELTRPDNSKVSGVKEAWDRFEDFSAYDRFTRNWLTQARRILKTNGALWVIGTYHNIFRVGAILQDLGFWILNDVIWCKSNPMPNFRGARFTNAHETLIWCAKSANARPTFNYDALKELNGEIQMRSDWFFPICTGSERLRDAMGAKAHPAQKPEGLLHRVLVGTTQKGDCVLDPFAGTGTTAVMAKKLGRRYVGIERDPAYVALSRERAAKTRPFDEATLHIAASRRREPRVPFGWLIERQILKPGDALTCASGRNQARVQADGRIAWANLTGSIHKIAAHVEGVPSCNGWKYWHVPLKGKRTPIDRLRDKIRAEMTQAVAG